MPDVPRAYFISLCKFDSFKNTFAMITSLSELKCRFRRFEDLNMRDGLFHNTRKLLQLMLFKMLWINQAANENKYG